MNKKQKAELLTEFLRAKADAKTAADKVAALDKQIKAAGLLPDPESFEEGTTTLEQDGFVFASRAVPASFAPKDGKDMPKALEKLITLNEFGIKGLAGIINFSGPKVAAADAEALLKKAGIINKTAGQRSVFIKARAA